MIATAAATAHASCIWYADDDSIHRIDTNNNQVAASARVAEPHRLVMNANDCGVWVLHKNDRKLLHFNEQGSLTLALRARDIDRRFDDIDHLKLDPYDNSLWLTDERRIVHLSANGQLIGAGFQAPDAIRRIPGWPGSEPVGARQTPPVELHRCGCAQGGVPTQPAFGH